MATKEEILGTFDSKEGAWFAYKEGIQVGYNAAYNSLRNQAAISCLSAIVGTMPKEVQGNYADVYAKEAVEYADALIEELKKK